MNDARNPNARVARAMAEELVRSGITEACISPGSRSSAMALALANIGGIRPWIVLDERCAGYFAVGMAREIERPVVLLSTSGTAVANYLPAVIEASLSQVPLVLLTADRPPELRDCHAPQTIDQVGIFGSHVRWSVDVPAPRSGIDLDAYYRTLVCRAVATALRAPRGPVHLNLPMREPLIDVAEELAALDSAAPPPGPESEPPHTKVYPSIQMVADEHLRVIVKKLEGCARGLIVCGPDAARKGEARSIARLAARLNWPILADPLSGLRFGVHDRSRVVDAYDVMLRDGAYADRHRPNAVIRLGEPPISKPLTLFLAGARAPVDLMVASAGTWPDPSHQVTDLIRADCARLCEGLADAIPARSDGSGWTESWLGASEAVRDTLTTRLLDEPTMFEGRVFSEVAETLGEGSILCVGNSMPVRDLDTFLGASPAGFAVRCNRGANGIDGVMSSAIGAAAGTGRLTVLVLGDLSFLHDVGALQIAARHSVHVTIVLIHNDGGGIFSFLPQAALGATFEKFFATPHRLDPEPVVRMCGGSYFRVESWDAFRRAFRTAREGSGLFVIEIPSERARNRELHQAIISAALDRLRALGTSGSL